MNQYLFDGQKAINLNSLPPEAWTTVGGGDNALDYADIKERYIRVPFLNRAVNLRANALASLPFAIVGKDGADIDTSDDYQNAVGFLPNPQRLLYLVESSLFLLGRSYLFRSYNRVKTLDLRYVLATTITPKFDQKLGLVGFKRQLSNEIIELTPEDLVYFWQLDPYVEIGPANSSAAMAALSAANVLYNVDSFAASFFERGAIKVTLLTTKGPVPEQERNRLKSWWSRLFRGSDSAWNSEIVQADAIEPVVLGEGIGELSDSELVKEKREDIATAAGVPVTLLWSTEASGLGGGGVVESDERKFYEQTVVPQADFIQGILNEQVFAPMGLRWAFRPETLDVFQEDEGKRAMSFAAYVGAGIRLSVAAQLVGIELPEGMDYETLDEQKEEDKEKAIERQREQFGGLPGERNPQSPQGNPQGYTQQGRQMRADLERWERKALNKGADCSFESEHIPGDVMASIRASLADAQTEEEIKAAFAAPFRSGYPVWSSYP